jgi:hypothetical protein
MRSVAGALAGGRGVGPKDLRAKLSAGAVAAPGPLLAVLLPTFGVAPRRAGDGGERAADQTGEGMAAGRGRGERADERSKTG